MRSAIANAMDAVLHSVELCGPIDDELALVTTTETKPYENG